MIQKHYDARTGEEVKPGMPLAMPPIAGSPQKPMAGLMDVAQPMEPPVPAPGQSAPPSGGTASSTPAPPPSGTAAGSAKPAAGGKAGTTQPGTTATGGVATPPPVLPPMPQPPVPVPPVTSLPSSQGGQLFDAHRKHHDAFSKGHVRVQKPESMARVEMFGGKDKPGKPMQEAESHPTGGAVAQVKPAKAPKIQDNNPGMPKASKTPKVHADAITTGAGSQGSYKQQGDTWTDAKKKGPKKPPPGKGVSKPPVQQQAPQGGVQAIAPMQAQEPQFDARKAKGGKR